SAGSGADPALARHPRVLPPRCHAPPLRRDAVRAPDLSPEPKAGTRGIPRSGRRELGVPRPLVGARGGAGREGPEREPHRLRALRGGPERLLAGGRDPGGDRGELGSGPVEEGDPLAHTLGRGGGGALPRRLRVLLPRVNEAAARSRAQSLSSGGRRSGMPSSMG